MFYVTAIKLLLPLVCVLSKCCRFAKTLLIVTHGGVLGQLLRYVPGVPLEMKRAYKFVNCAYNHFSFHPEEASVLDPETLNKDEQKASGR
ncbi:histidine phosphatase family protein [Rubellicoccus peritrichatus]|uniref:Histidine phosphatase family protein n=1 Tax=Rubellicoccus peritrichatus TaxID=3080537 RepID=A0AAQ3LFQ5_9BACT|nr:histidine phosphatase family protein [Puniceicoccus sp. CR14]WOO42985.1 histidine phosphatase family protein [Puniceicoccus sp. CR14]